LINKRFFPKRDDFMFSLIYPARYEFRTAWERNEAAGDIIT